MNATPRQARTRDPEPPAPDRPLRTVDALSAAGLIDPAKTAGTERAAATFPPRVSSALLAAIRTGDPDDPVARQFVPNAAELAVHPEDRVDPIGDTAFSPVPGIVHRHPDRVLLKPTLSCPVHCRFCFRRTEVGTGGALSPARLADALAYIERRPEIREVILTGGDPLMLSAERLAGLSEDLGSIPHVKLLRIHSRVPVADPVRITPPLIDALARGGLPVFLVVHTNHVAELGPEARRALDRLADAGLPLLSQTVLLAGVNDDADVLATLFETLTELRVRPYYLHHGDLVPGAAHFRTSLDRGREIVADLRRRLSGLAMPTYTLDIPGGHGKVPAERAHVSEDGTSVRDSAGGTHPYPIAKGQDTC